MVQLVETIDAIARRLKRDVVFLSFDKLKNPPREEILTWLQQNDFASSPCLEFRPGWVIYEGKCTELYLDIVYDPQSPKFMMLDRHFENEDQSAAIEGVRLYLLPLEDAMINSEQDGPGFFDD